MPDRPDGDDGPGEATAHGHPSNRHVPQSGPIGGDIAGVVAGLGARFRIPALTSRHSSTAIMGAFAFANGVLSIAVMSAAALLTGQPFIFPSLGPTAFLLFYTPTAPAASPRNTVCGHAIGVAAGYLSLLLFGLIDAGPALAARRL